MKQNLGYLRLKLDWGQSNAAGDVEYETSTDVYPAEHGMQYNIG